MNPSRCPTASPSARGTDARDANQHGDIFGGWVMSQVESRGASLASRRARGRVATVAVNSFLFKQPVLVGDLVSFFAEVSRVGRTSSRSRSRCTRSAIPRTHFTVKVTEASLTYVAVGAIGGRASCGDVA